MANNNWNNYTEKTATPVDADEVMVRDSADGKNKKLLFGTFWKWVAKKLNEATISELQTSNKTIVGALNQLNSESLHAIFIEGPNNDFVWAKNYWYAIPESSWVKFVYNSSGIEYFYIFIKRINAHGLVLRFSYNAPIIEMIRFVNKECANDGEKFDAIK